MAMDLGRLGPSVLSPARHSMGLQGDHLVQLYEDDAALADAVRTFLGAGIAGGGAAVVVADAAHRDMFDRALASSGVDLEAARAQGRYISLDATETLAGFMVDGTPDQAKFTEVIGGLLDRAALCGTSVRVFGEMVALLWAEGNIAGAILLEEMWNRLAETHRFKLFCAYPARAFDSDDLLPLRRVCHEHSHVIPPQR